MATIQDTTLGRTRLSFANEAEIDEFVDVLGRYERGEISADQWRAFRLVRGTYGQRQTGDAQMLRVKIPQGILDGAQLAALADVAEQYSRGFGHITTRQNVQFHFVRLHDVEPAMRQLAASGLTTREACGNSVRNVTACPYAGVSADEIFDVTPYAEAFTRHFLRHPLSSTLPRKFKVAFEGCPEDHAVTGINDIGWRARVRREHGVVRHGFRVTVGGGTAIMCRSGYLLYDFLPAGQMLDVAEAILRVFHRLGDYKHKQHNRMKFLIKALGWERWRAEFDAALAAIAREGGATLPFDPDAPPLEEPPPSIAGRAPSLADTAARVGAQTLKGPGLWPRLQPTLTVTTEAEQHWLRTNVHRQVQPGFVVVTVAVPLGDFTAAQMRTIAELASAYGDGTVRVTHRQDLVFRWIAVEHVRDLYRRLAAASLALPDANTIADVTSCPGAESCRIAVTQSRGLGRLLEDHLRAHPELVAAAADATIKISGCPNGCGQHHVASIGFQGSVRKVGDKAVPQYFVTLGGGADEEGATFGRLAAKIPARRMTEALERLIRLYVDERRPGEAAQEFFRRIAIERVRREVADLERLTEEDAVPADYVDLGELEEFKPEVMDGECSA